MQVLIWVIYWVMVLVIINIRVLLVPIYIYINTIPSILLSLLIILLSMYLILIILLLLSLFYTVNPLQFLIINLMIRNRFYIGTINTFFINWSRWGQTLHRYYLYFRDNGLVTIFNDDVLFVHVLLYYFCLSIFIYIMSMIIMIGFNLYCIFTMLYTYKIAKSNSGQEHEYVVMEIKHCQTQYVNVPATIYDI